jgi:hypothetical protein
MIARDGEFFIRVVEKSLKKCVLGFAQSLLKNWWRKSNLGSDMRSASEKESLLPIVKVIFKSQEPAEKYVRPRIRILLFLSKIVKKTLIPTVL